MNSDRKEKCIQRRLSLQPQLSADIRPVNADCSLFDKKHFCNLLAFHAVSDHLADMDFSCSQ